MLLQLSLGYVCGSFVSYYIHMYLVNTLPHIFTFSSCYTFFFYTLALLQLSSLCSFSSALSCAFEPYHLTTAFCSLLPYWCCTHLLISLVASSSFYVDIFIHHLHLHLFELLPLHIIHLANYFCLR